MRTNSGNTKQLRIHSCLTTTCPRESFSEETPVQVPEHEQQQTVLCVVLFFVGQGISMELLLPTLGCPILVTYGIGVPPCSKRVFPWQAMWMNIVVTSNNTSENKFTKM
eukprot:8038888-Heterocapsa_arctica.AAC.1